MTTTTRVVKVMTGVGAKGCAADEGGIGRRGTVERRVRALLTIRMAGPQVEVAGEAACSTDLLPRATSYSHALRLCLVTCANINNCYTNKSRPFSRVTRHTRLIDGLSEANTCLIVQKSRDSQVLPQDATTTQSCFA